MSIYDMTGFASNGAPGHHLLPVGCLYEGNTNKVSGGY